MDLESIYRNEKRQHRENASSVLKKILIGNIVLLIIGIIAFSFLLVAMQVI